MAISSPSVLVIGGGPIGLTLAGDLGGRGVSCLLDESGDGTVAQPKMDMVGVRSMEFCRRWGIVDWVHAAGYNRDYRRIAREGGRGGRAFDAQVP